jgi:hypothetical protein
VPITPAQHREPADILGEVRVEPMEPMRPNLGEAIAKGMAPTADMMPHLEGPMLDAGDQQSQARPMFRRGQQTGYSGIVCPMNSIGNCCYCTALPCTALKAKVLEVVALEYKVLAGQHR